MRSNHLPTDYQAFIHKSRYARWLDKEARRETWSETVSRYMEHIVIPNSGDNSYTSEIEQAILSLDVMPSMGINDGWSCNGTRQYSWVQLFILTSR